MTASIVYTAVIRGKVALPCDVTPPTADDSVALILWYKDDALAPIYTLDARRVTRLECEYTLLSPPLFERRAYFNLKNRPAFLQIDPIRVTDAGDYRCRVDFKKARTVNTVISLKVIVPPEEPRILSAHGKQLKGLVGPFNEGDRLTLICTTNGGKPRPSLIWWRDFVIIDDAFEYNEKDGESVNECVLMKSITFFRSDAVTTNQLTIASLARHHLLSIFMCQAINNNITVPSSTAITLDLNCE
ncbi:protein turtle B-like protein [Leptotrombidium deliense]|uniref:Protein turtle B-like protein n=1 Tax=Leptotrombidium deliense TaxID=299467 RepID=A0A443SWX4_9ACAR|nr:protein turtle B-like protein [Leptotrombidium deliense]